MGDRPSSTEDLAAAIRGLTQAISRLSVQASDEDWELVAAPQPLTPRDPNPHPSSGYPSSPAGAQTLRTLSPASSAREPPAPPPVSSEALFFVRSLSKADREPRATRAWEAGYYAGLVLQGHRRAVPATPPITVRSNVYVLLRSPSGAPPAAFRSFRAFSAATGRIAGPTFVCHGFPTEGEARCYCLGAGVAFPPWA